MRRDSTLENRPDTKNHDNDVHNYVHTIGYILDWYH